MSKKNKSDNGLYQIFSKDCSSYYYFLLKYNGIFYNISGVFENEEICKDYGILPDPSKLKLNHFKADPELYIEKCKDQEQNNAILINNLDQQTLEYILTKKTNK